MGNEVREGALRHVGFRLISNREIARFYEYILGAVNDPTGFSQAIIGMDVESLANPTTFSGTIDSATFNEVRHARPGAGSIAIGEGLEAAGSGQTIDQVIANSDAEALVDFISGPTTVQLARLISVDAGSIDAREGPIMALGLDSLVAVGLCN